MAMLAEWWSDDGASAPGKNEALVVRRARPFLRHSARDAWLVGVAVIQSLASITFFVLAAGGGALSRAAAIAIFGVGICWCSNTVSHNHLHNPLFSSRRNNRAFDLWLTLVLGVPQAIWKARHVWHHAGEPQQKRLPLARSARLQIMMVAAGWLVFLVAAPRLFLLTYVPGYILGMGLCRVQGDMEHALDDRPERGISHYGRLYNFFWFNDGHHAEHHQFPSEHWTRLPMRRHELTAPTSAFPPHVRFVGNLLRRQNALKGVFLCALERLALASKLLQSFLLESHSRAIAPLLATLPTLPTHVTIVGGGLFPRSLLVLAELLPNTRFTVVDRSSDNVARALAHLRLRSFDLTRVQFCIAGFDPALHCRAGLLVAPLGFVGDPSSLGEAAQLTSVLRHDWVWGESAGLSRVVSWLLLKRVTLEGPAR